MAEELTRTLTALRNAARKALLWSVAWFVLAAAGFILWRYGASPSLRLTGIVILSAAVLRVLIAIPKDRKRLAQMREVRATLEKMKGTLRG